MSEQIEKAREVVRIWRDSCELDWKGERLAGLIAQALADAEERGRNFGYLEGRAGQFSRAVLKQLNDRLTRENAVLREGLRRSFDKIVGGSGIMRVHTEPEWILSETLAQADAIRAEGGSE